MFGKIAGGKKQPSTLLKKPFAGNFHWTSNKEYRCSVVAIYPLHFPKFCLNQKQ